MAEGVTVFNYWKYKQLNNFAGKTFKLLLMQPGYTQNKGTQTVYTDISANEVATAYGYTKGTGISLTVGTIAQDNTNNWGILPFTNVSFTPSGGNISIAGAIIWDETDDILVDYYDAGGTVTITDGIPYYFTDIAVRNK